MGAQKNRCPWDAGTCEFVPEGGSLEVLQLWALENGCPHVINKRVQKLRNLASYCLEVLKWARENGCPWDEHTCESAAASGRHTQVVECMGV